MVVPVIVSEFVKDPESEDGSFVLNLTEAGGSRSLSVHVLPHDPILREVSVALLKSDPTITVEPSLEVQKFIETLEKNGGKFTEVVIRQVDGYEIEGEDDNADITARLTVRMPHGDHKFIDVLLMQGIILALYCDAKIFVEQTLFDLMSFDWGNGQGKKQNQKHCCPTCGYAEDQPLRDAELLRRYIRSIDVLEMGSYTIKDLTNEESESYNNA